MAGDSSFLLQRRAKLPTQRAAPVVLPIASAHRHSHTAQTSALPPLPDAMPLRPKAREYSSLRIGAAHSPLEAEADAMASRVMHGARNLAESRPADLAFSSSQAPPVVLAALESPGQPLDFATRAYMESRFGRDLRAVRVHAGPEAAGAARSVEAEAYTVGQDIFFASGRFRPHTLEGRRLLAHELSHTVQQSGGGPGLSAAAPAIHRQPNNAGTQSTDPKKGQPQQVTLPLPPNVFSQLFLPSLRGRGQAASPLSPGPLTLGSTGSGDSTNQTTPSLFPPLPKIPATAPLSPTSGQSPALTPVPQVPPSTPASAAPDRISLYDIGSLSIGARFGFPDMDAGPGLDGSPTALQRSIQKAELLNFIFTKQPPSEYSVDPGKIISAVWGIFSTKISPSTAAKIAASMSSKPHNGGLSYELDATILVQPDAHKIGGGLGGTFTLRF